MDADSVRMLLGLVSEGVGVASRIAELARRVRSGETITDEEIIEARKRVSDAVNEWNEVKS